MARRREEARPGNPEVEAGSPSPRGMGLGTEPLGLLVPAPTEPEGQTRASTGGWPEGTTRTIA